jgi:hypothetical protein
MYKLRTGKVSFLAPARTRLARKQNAGLLVGSPSFADTAGLSRSQPKMEDNLFTSPKEVGLSGEQFCSCWFFRATSGVMK